MVDQDKLPDTGAVFTFGRSQFADNIQSHFFIKNDPVVCIACGDNHTVAVCESGRVFSFGNNEWGQLGLGHSHITQRPLCIKKLKPFKVKSVAGGRAHTLVLSDEKLFSFGNNSDGQLGLGDVIDKKDPEEITFFDKFSFSIVQIEAGSNHSVILTDEGKCYGWGSNSCGQLGLEGSLTMVTNPTIIPIPEKIKSISCGDFHTVLVTEIGLVYICGNIDQNKPKITFETMSNSALFAPKLIDLKGPIIAVYSGGNQAFFVHEDGNIYAMGSNEHGELGLDNANSKIHHPTEINKKHFENETIVTISCGDRHTGFVTESGKLYTCGDYKYEKLCYEANTLVKTPKEVRKFQEINFKVKKVACGNTHTIVLAIPNTEKLKKSTKENDIKKNDDKEIDTAVSTLITKKYNEIPITVDEEIIKVEDGIKKLPEDLDIIINDTILDSTGEETQAPKNAIILPPLTNVKEEMESKIIEISPVKALDLNYMEAPEVNTLEELESNILEEHQSNSSDSSVLNALEETKTDILPAVEINKIEVLDNVDNLQITDNIDKEILTKIDNDEVNKISEIGSGDMIKTMIPVVNSVAGLTSQKYDETKNPFHSDNEDINKTGDFLKVEQIQYDTENKLKIMNSEETLISEETLQIKDDELSKQDTEDDIDLSDDDADIQIKPSIQLKKSFSSKICKFFQNFRKNKVETIDNRHLSSADTERPKSVEEVLDKKGTIKSPHNKQTSKICTIL